VSRHLHAALSLTAALALPSVAIADAVIRSQAMFATTIAEYFIEEDRVRVELEIGLSELDSFRNLVPDEIHAKLGGPPVPLRERLPRFFGEDLTLVADDGPPLPGHLLHLESRPRMKRDPISGEPLPASEDEPEIALFAQLEYVLPGRPAALTLRGLAGASVGFVAYHRGIAVNDFRYLMPSQTLDLDWEDPWYTSFRTRSLRRQYFAPMSGFLYVEPYEVRKEIIVRPLDLQRWVDLGLAGRETIPAEIQPELKRKVAAFLREHHPVEIDGRSIAPDLARIHFLSRTLRTSRVIDPPVDLEVHSAILGVIFVYPTDGLPERVTMKWDLWDGRLERIPVASVDQAGALPGMLEPDWTVLEWQNFLKHPVLPSLRVLPPPPSALARGLGTLRWALLVGTLMLAWRWRTELRRRAPALALALLATAAAFAGSRDAGLSDARARTIVADLLRNVYLAFDFRGEERIYDTLARTVDGELLTQIYVETRRGLELASQGGARAKVKDVELIDLAAEPTRGGGFRAVATWNVAGSVGHWGHVHQRRNRYRARLDVAPVENQWKIVALEILEESRL
jgi:hypothetical protein